MRLYFSILLLIVCVAACTAGEIIKFNKEDKGGSIIDDITVSNDVEIFQEKKEETIAVLELDKKPSFKAGKSNKKASIVADKKYYFIKVSFKPVSSFSDLDVRLSENNVLLSSIAPEKVLYKPSSYWYGDDRKLKVRKKALSLPSKFKSKFAFDIGNYVAEVNEGIIQDRKDIKKIFLRKELGENISQKEISWLRNKSMEYKVKNFSLNSALKRSELLRKIDIIPESLAIAQAAIESGWGKSRFAKEGNNYFGHWCYDKGCGIVPSQRSKYKTHEVKKFASTKEAVEEYIHNLNTNKAYKNFRIARENLGVRISGEQLAGYLSKYSAQGKTYTRKLRSIINYNKLD